MGGMFGDCQVFNQRLDSWDVSRVTSMAQMFVGCKRLHQDLSSWNVSQVTDMQHMFLGCPRFPKESTESWDTSHASNTGDMFD